ncbi:MAG TPA: hypothetical protein VN695_14565 [Streptosporangiaceae bacterium]|nr:hypothetical protein [Streptosporangiaceae bacterium]
MSRIVSNAQAGRVDHSRRDPAGWSRDTALTVATCVMLGLFGMVQALVGAFFYGVGPAPAASITFDLAILATCLLGAWGLGRPLGGVIPAIGWFVVAFVLASGTGGGSVLITASAAGEWFLFGGAACATAGIVAVLTLWSRFGLGRQRR